MSFDLHLFALEPGPDESTRALARLEALSASSMASRARVDAKEQRKEHLASLIVAHDPSYVRPRLRDEDFAELFGITLEEARSRSRHLELNGPPQLKLAQILLHDDHITIHWYSGTSREEMFEILELLARETGWVVFDPQDGAVHRFVEPERMG